MRADAKLVVRRGLGAAVVAVALLGAAACSDDGDEASDAGTEQSAGEQAGGGEALTQADLEAFTAAAQAGTTEGPEFVACQADAVKAAVDAGDLAADDVRDWYEGTGFDGPVQELITSQEVVVECMGIGSSGATTP